MKRTPPERAPAKSTPEKRERAPPVPNPVDDELYGELELALRIDENALDEAEIRQVDCYHEASKQLKFLISRRDAAKQHLAEAEAEAYLHVKGHLEKAEADGKKKATENEIKAYVVQDRQVRDANATLLALSEQVGKWQALVSSYEQRSYALKDLAALWIAGYNGARAPLVRDVNREALAAERRRRG